MGPISSQSMGPNPAAGSQRPPDGLEAKRRWVHQFQNVILRIKGQRLACPERSVKYREEVELFGYEVRLGRNRGRVRTEKQRGDYIVDRCFYDELAGAYRRKFKPIGGTEHS
jgi:hypothetical protein